MNSFNIPFKTSAHYFIYNLALLNFQSIGRVRKILEPIYHKKVWMVVTHAFKPSTGETEAGESLWVCDQTVTLGNPVLENKTKKNQTKTSGLIFFNQVYFQLKFYDLNTHFLPLHFHFPSPTRRVSYVQVSIFCHIKILISSTFLQKSSFLYSTDKQNQLLCCNCLC